MKLRQRWTPWHRLDQLCREVTLPYAELSADIHTITLGGQ